MLSFLSFFRHYIDFYKSLQPVVLGAIAVVLVVLLILIFKLKNIRGVVLLACASVALALLCSMLLKVGTAFFVVPTAALFVICIPIRFIFKRK